MRKKIKSASLRHVIDIEEKIQAQDPVTGEVTVSWQAVHTGVRASIEPLSVRDYIQSSANQSEISVRIGFRFMPDLDPAMRIVGRCPCHNKIYNPEAFLEDAHSGLEYLTAPCSQGVNEG